MANDFVSPPPAVLSALSLASATKAYKLPLIFFAISMVFQLFVIPRSFPLSHYDVLGIKRYSSIEAVKEAYGMLSSKWHPGTKDPTLNDFVKIQYAFELLSHPLWKRNYDIFGIEEQFHVSENLKAQHAGTEFSEIKLPLLDDVASDLSPPVSKLITSKDFPSIFNKNEAWLVQIYSHGSKDCSQFSKNWGKIVTLLNGVANTGMVEVADAQLAAYLAERKPTGQAFFHNGIPSLVAFPSDCQSAVCLIRYDGELSVDAITDWFATTVLGLPRIRYHSMNSLGQNFLAKASPHKVKVIFFSKTGERASPFVRQAAKDYWAFASFAFVLWREEDFSFWWTAFGVESAPAFVILKDPGIKPLVYHGWIDNTWFADIIERNKQQELPQLRSLTSVELGCDARGYSRAGNDTLTWYCVIVAGRLSPVLDKMRETMRRVHEMVASGADSNAVNEDEWLVPSATALKEKRLTFAWLDGETQSKYCFFYIHQQTAYDTCGPRRDVVDVPQLFVVRYKRNATEESKNVKRTPTRSFDAFLNPDMDPAAQLVANYNGSMEIPQIVRWISQIIKDGDSRNLPFYRTKTPDLIPEDTDTVWLRAAQGIVTRSQGTKRRMYNTIRSFSNQIEDPRIGPVFLLAAFLSFGSIWLKRSQSTQPNQSNQSGKSSAKAEERKRRRNRSRSMSYKHRPTSVTDVEPKDAYQIPNLSDDSD